MSDRATRDWEHYSENVEAILTDLIAELRALNQNRDGGMWADDVHDVADRAEAQMREGGF